MPSWNAYPPETRDTDVGRKLNSRWKAMGKSERSPEFAKYLDFYAWAMASGFQPGMRLVRLDNTKPYAPDNCKWKWMQAPLIFPGGEDGRRAWASKWNATVNVFRERCGLKPFPVEDMKNEQQKEQQTESNTCSI